MSYQPIIVCGLPRCGSSLVMQMLAAAGIPCAGKYPMFDNLKQLDLDSEELMPIWRGGAFKMLEPHLHAMPAGFKYRFIFLTRSRRQQALSQFKLQRAMGEIDSSLSDSDIEQREDMLRKEESAAFESIRNIEGAILKVNFEDIINRPGPTIDRICWFLQIENEAEMLECIRPRSVTCYPGMMELDLMREAKEAEEAEELPPYDPSRCNCHISPPCHYCSEGQYNPDSV